jgi:hypothetical protein
MEENTIPKKELYMNLESKRPRGRPRNRWLVEKTSRNKVPVHNREELRRFWERQGIVAFCIWQWNE